jgi:hypothetical protein
MNQKRKRIKWLLILEGIVFYFALLNIISHVRGPIPYQIDTNRPIIQMQDFKPMTEMGVDITEVALPIYNAKDGEPAGYTGEVNLKGLECLSIQFQVEVPAQFAGNTLIVDLYDYESGYDDPEQEFHVVLQEGVNDVCIELLPGSYAPDTGELRFFTVNPADYQITDLRVFQKTAMPKVTASMIATALVVGLLWSGTILYSFMQKKEPDV